MVRKEHRAKPGLALAHDADGADHATCAPVPAAEEALDAILPQQRARGVTQGAVRLLLYVALHAGLQWRYGMVRVDKVWTRVQG